MERNSTGMKTSNGLGHTGSLVTLNRKLQRSRKKASGRCFHMEGQTWTPSVQSMTFRQEVSLERKGSISWGKHKEQENIRSRKSAGSSIWGESRKHSGGLDLNMQVALLGTSTGSLARKPGTIKSRKTHGVREWIGVILCPNDIIFLITRRLSVTESGHQGA